MNEEAFQIAVEEELGNIFGYYRRYYRLVKMVIQYELSGYLASSSGPELGEIEEEVYQECDEQDAEKKEVYQKHEQRTELEEIEIDEKKLKHKVFILVFIGVLILVAVGFISWHTTSTNRATTLFIVVSGLAVLITGFSFLSLLYIIFKNTAEVKKKKKAEEIEKQSSLETLGNLNAEIHEESVWKNSREIKEFIKNYSIQEASNLLEKEDIRKRLCPALKSVADDVFDISKSVTPVLVGCVVSGTISIPLNPVLFAAIAVVIARMSISALCAGYITK